MSQDNRNPDAWPYDSLEEAANDNPRSTIELQPYLLQPFLTRIDRMNRVMEIDLNALPTDLGGSRVSQLYDILCDEVSELDDIPKASGNELDRLVGIADLLGDLIVYAASEFRRWGIPPLPILHIIMDSQDSKLDEDGKPIKDPDTGKFLKGPNYQKPEPLIRSYIERLRKLKRDDPYVTWIGRKLTRAGEVLVIRAYDPIGHHSGTASFASGPHEAFFVVTKDSEEGYRYLTIKTVVEESLMLCD